MLAHVPALLNRTVKHTSEQTAPPPPRPKARPMVRVSEHECTLPGTLRDQRRFLVLDKVVCGVEPPFSCTYAQEGFPESDTAGRTWGLEPQGD